MIQVVLLALACGICVFVGCVILGVFVALLATSAPLPDDDEPVKAGDRDAESI